MSRLSLLICEMRANGRGKENFFAFSHQGALCDESGKNRLSLWLLLARLRFISHRAINAMMSLKSTANWVISRPDQGFLIIIKNPRRRKKMLLTRSDVSMPRLKIFLSLPSVVEARPSAHD
jgi:hypothetical protein